VNSSKITRTIGTDVSCDLRLDHASLSSVHASLELAPDGLVSLSEQDQTTPIFLHRNDRWIRVRRVTLCIGDRIRLGELELPLQRFTSVFGQRSNARLETIRFSFDGIRHGHSLLGPLSEHGGQWKRPRRNPATGKIEDKLSRSSDWQNH
jgi:hypothetical protein